jgi:hypothetical protein
MCPNLKSGAAYFEVRRRLIKRLTVVMRIATKTAVRKTSGNSLGESSPPPRGPNITANGASIPNQIRHSNG